MTQSSGPRDATICSKCCKRLDPSQRCAGAHSQAAEMAGRSIAQATQDMLWKTWHSRSATPWSIQNKVASAKPARAAFATGLQWYVYWAMCASVRLVSWLYLDVERGAAKTTHSGAFCG